MWMTFLEWAALIAAVSLTFFGLCAWTAPTIDKDGEL